MAAELDDWLGDELEEEDGADEEALSTGTKTTRGAGAKKKPTIKEKRGKPAAKEKLKRNDVKCFTCPVKAKRGSKFCVPHDRVAAAMKYQAERDEPPSVGIVSCHPERHAQSKAGD